jgi:hypothetical protein
MRDLSGFEDGADFMRRPRRFWTPRRHDADTRELFGGRFGFQGLFHIIPGIPVIRFGLDRAAIFRDRVVGLAWPRRTLPKLLCGSANLGFVSMARRYSVIAASALP